MSQLALELASERSFCPKVRRSSGVFADSFHSRPAGHDGVTLLRKTPALGRRLRIYSVLFRTLIRCCLDPLTNCASPGPTSHDSLSRSTKKDQYPNVVHEVLALSISSDDTAATHPRHSQLALCCPALRPCRWRLARLPYRSFPATSCACYLTCICPVIPLNKC